MYTYICISLYIRRRKRHINITNTNRGPCGARAPRLPESRHAGVFHMWTRELIGESARRAPGSQILPARPRAGESQLATEGVRKEDRKEDGSETRGATIEDNGTGGG